MDPYLTTNTAQPNWDAMLIILTATVGAVVLFLLRQRRQL